MSTAGARPAPARNYPRPPAAPAYSQREHRRFLQLLLLCDVALAAAALGLALFIRSRLPWLHGGVELPTALVCLAFVAVFLILAGVHRGVAPHAPERHVLSGSGLVTVALFLLALFAVRRIGSEISRPAFISFIALWLFGLIAVHEAMVRLQRTTKERFPRNILIVGDPVLSAFFAREVTPPPQWNVVEAISDRGASGEAIAARIERAIRTCSLDAVVLVPSNCEPHSGAAHARQAVIQVCEATGTRLQVYANWLGDHCHVSLDRFGSVPVLSFDFSPDELSWSLLLKRFQDVGLAAMLLVLASPVMLLAALAIKCDSRGPALFKQFRAGRGGKPFLIYKFRTMVADAEERKSNLLAYNEISGPTFKMDCDPRLTRVGRFLRRSSIDELPQLWNVLRGDMSLVGPRPHPIEEAHAYATAHFRRLSMKPGITGLWQVSGRTSIPNFERWVQLDVDYIRDWSLWLDLKIMGRTCVTVLRMTGR